MRAAFGGRGDLWLLAGLAACLPVLAVPVGDPDLWWHLSAARRMLETGAFPRAEWLSFTRGGLPWVDFEWLSQLAFYGAWRVGGLEALLFLKGLLLAAAAAVLDRGMRARGVPASARAAAAAFWVVTSLPRSDIRTELFSFVLFAVLVARKAPLAPAAAAGLFALWANLHAGFAYGLLLLGAEAVVARWREPAAFRARAFAFGAALAGTLLNPYGWGIYRVLWTHAREVAGLRGLIAEWAPLRLRRPPHWPVWAALAAAVCAIRWPVSARAAGGRALAGLALGAMTLAHCRVAPYFCALALPWAVPALLSRRPGAGAGALLGALLAFGLWATWAQGTFRRAWHDAYLPLRTAAFLAKNPALLDGEVYHPWGWGGYLGFRFAPRLRVFQDGRYLFHGLLVETSRAVARPKSWSDFMDLWQIDVAVVENVPLRLPSDKGLRPYYATYLPQDKWFLAHFDERALVFVRRGFAPLSLQETLEFRALRPDERESSLLAEQIGPGGKERLAAERERHARGLAALEVRP